MQGGLRDAQGGDKEPGGGGEREGSGLHGLWSDSALELPILQVQQADQPLLLVIIY